MDVATNLVMGTKVEKPFTTPLRVTLETTPRAPVVCPMTSVPVWNRPETLERPTVLPPGSDVTLPVPDWIVAKDNWAVVEPHDGDVESVRNVLLETTFTVEYQ